MRSAICFLLILAFCLSLACPAAAVRHSSAGDDGKPPFGSGSMPQTGDQIMMYVIVMIVSLAALVVLIVLFRKKFGK